VDDNEASPSPDTPVSTLFLSAWSLPGTGKSAAYPDFQTR